MQEEEEKKEMNFEELKQSHARKDKQIAQRDEQIAQQDAQIERLRRDLKTAHTLLHDGDSGCVTVYMCVCVCLCASYVWWFIILRVVRVCLLLQRKPLSV